jgi:hypothetical protein
VNLNAKPDYQPWNEDVFSGDLLVGAMTPIQRWMYRTLLQKAFFYSTRPDLPTDENILWLLSGCETRQQWEENKEPVLNMFKLDERDGEEIYWQKRLRQDWDRIASRRESLSDRGKLGASSRWGSLSEPAKVQQKGLPYLKLIPESCRKILGMRAEKEDWYKKDLKELAETYGGTEVVTAFDEWAKSLTSTPKYPIREFIKVADGYLQNKVIPEHSELEPLCISLYAIGGQTFTGKYRQMLNSLTTEFSISEIERAYGTFVAGKDEYDMKFAVRDFCEGAAKTIILSARKKAEDQSRQEQELDKLTEAARQETELELASLEETEEIL